ncbi:MAG TPA: EboA domain-containing protein, partial [Gammaproteobacteria bacterium]
SQSLPQDIYVDSINALYKTADVNEMVLLGQSLAFVPHAELFLDRARESARSNIVTVFSSIAHDSDYPRRHFDQTAWNQLVLKAAFLAVPIWSIAGLKERNNPELVVMLRHYVNERQAAKRSVPWDLWCCIGWLAQSGDELEYLRQQWQSAGMKTQGAITLALSENPSKAAQATAGMLSLPGHPASELSWSKLAEWPE